MSYNFTLAQLSLLLKEPGVSERWYDSLRAAMVHYEISSAIRISSFLTHCAYMTKRFTEMEENLNYSAEDLVKTWPNIFSTENAALYAGNPEKIANKAYSNIQGNGSEESGDGYRFRGRGLLMIRGRSDYAACSQALFQDSRLVDTPDLVKDNPTCINSAGWFWSTNNYNVKYDTDTAYVQFGQPGNTTFVANLTLDNTVSIPNINIINTGGKSEAALTSKESQSAISNYSSLLPFILEITKV